MKRFLIGIVLLIIFFVLILSFATQADMYDIKAAEMGAEASVTVAWIYAVAIVIAGCVISVGVYFGLRSRKSRE